MTEPEEAVVQKQRVVDGAIGLRRVDDAGDADELPVAHADDSGGGIGRRVDVEIARGGTVPDGGLVRSESTLHSRCHGIDAGFSACGRGSGVEILHGRRRPLHSRAWRTMLGPQQV